MKFPWQCSGERCIGDQLWQWCRERMLRPMVFSYVTGLALADWIILKRWARDTILYPFTVPCIMAAFFFERWVYLPMMLILATNALWVSYLVSPSWSASVSNILVAAASSILAAELIHALVVARERVEMALRESEEKLRAALNELRAHNEELDAFAHTVAHDLKNPLASLLGFGQILESRWERLEDERRRHLVRLILQSGRRMHNIIDELLLLASVRKMEEVELAPLRMEEIVAEAIERLHYLIEKHGAKIVRPQQWPKAWGYAPWVTEVWVNYISNAIKYGGHPPRVVLGAEEQEGVVRFWVRDNGEGLTPEEQTRLFVPFKRIQQVRAQGHGLGLSIVRRIVRRLGGQVGVESPVPPALREGPDDDGRGCLFYFTLPKGPRERAVRDHRADGDRV